MDTVELAGWGVFRGTHYGSVGVYTNAGAAYAGGRKAVGARAHGQGVGMLSDGRTYSGQLADGNWHGHREVHWANGDVGYRLFERGKRVHSARVRPDGDCFYDDEPCGADHADFAKLQTAAQQAGVRTCPLPASNAMPAPSAIPRRTRRFGFSHCARFWCLPSARGSRRASASVRVCMCACVCVCVSLRVRVFVRARACTIVCAWVRVNLCARVCVHMRLGVRERVYVREFVYMCA